jgi:hypothetical protein
MSDLTEPRRGTVPKVVKVAGVIIYVQAVASVFIAAAQLVSVVQQVQHGQDVSGLAYFGAVLNPLVAILLLVCAALVMSGRPSGRPLALMLEAVVILNGVMNVVSGYVAAVTEIVIALVVLVLLSLTQVRNIRRG